jgi:signal transduction histidine kinase
MPRFRTKHARWPRRSAGISLMTGVARLRPGHVIFKIETMDRLDAASGVSSKRNNDRGDQSLDSLEKVNADLKDQNRKLRELAEHRSASIAHLAHELRTPLTSIIGFSEILLTQEELTDAQRNFCERIQNSAHQLQNSLVQLGELSRLENLREEDPPSD